MMVQVSTSSFTVTRTSDFKNSGSTTILESYRALLAADFRPVRNVEFQWYSAEVRLEPHQLWQTTD